MGARVTIKSWISNSASRLSMCNQEVEHEPVFNP